MSQHGLPQFGDWAATGDTPYTQKFENLRRSKRTGAYSNPNELIGSPEPPRRSPLNPSSHTPVALNQRQKKYQPHERKPEPDHHRRPVAGSPSPHHREMVPRRHTNPPLHQHQLDQGSGHHGGSHRSPYREAAAAAAAAAGAASPAAARPSAKHRPDGMQASERKASSSSDGRAPMTPARSRLKQGSRGFGAAEDEVTVPPFGEWDESNAASGEKYTGIFNRVRHDKLSPNSSVKQAPSSSGNQEHKVKQGCSCCIL